MVELLVWRIGSSEGIYKLLYLTRPAKQADTQKLTEVLEQGHKTVICEDVYFSGFICTSSDTEGNSKNIIIFFLTGY